MTTVSILPISNLRRLRSAVFIVLKFKLDLIQQSSHNRSPLRLPVSYYRRQRQQAPFKLLGVRRALPLALAQTQDGPIRQAIVTGKRTRVIRLMED